MQNCRGVSHCSCSALKWPDQVKKVPKVKLYGWTAQPHSPILWCVIRTFTVDLWLFCSHSTTAAAAIVTGAFPLDWSRFSPVDWERQWHAPTNNECTRDVSAWRLSPRFLPCFLNQYLSGRWAPRSPPYLWGAGTLAGGLGLGFKGRDQTEQGTDTKSMALSKPLTPHKEKAEFLSGDYICSPASDPLAPFSLLSSIQLRTANNVQPGSSFQCL